MKKEAVITVVAGMLIIAALLFSITTSFFNEKNLLTGTTVLERIPEISCPIDKGTITAGFQSAAYYRQFRTVHNGIDFGSPANCGTEVKAMAAGLAKFQYDNAGYRGNWIEIEHGDGITTRYLHLNSFANAKPGSQREVNKGDAIGYIGNTGKSTGCHLHFEIRVNGIPVDPADYVCRFECEEGWCDAYSALVLTDEEMALLKYVDKKTGLSSSYPPSGALADLRDSVSNVRAADSRASQLLVNDLKQLMQDARKSGIELYIQSAYRSYDSQQKLFESYVRQEMNSGLSESEAKVKANTYSAMPGHSEHQLGTAIDFSTPENKYELEVSFAGTKAGTWLFNNAEKYGFVLSYPEGKESLTGYQHEPWHYRYIGTKFADELLKLNYKDGGSQITPNSFIQKKLEEARMQPSSYPGLQQKAEYDAHILYSVKPSFRETINYDASEIQKIRETAKEIAKCRTDSCVKDYNNKEIEGLKWKTGSCENNEEEKFNELASILKECAASKDNYCSCGTFNMGLKNYDIKLKQENNELKIALLKNEQIILAESINTDIAVYSQATSQKEEIKEILMSEVCLKYPDFCERNNEIEIARYGSVVFNRKFISGSGQPLLRKCGSERAILLDTAPSQQQYAQIDSFTVNIGYRMRDLLKDTDEGIAITKFGSGMPRGSHADSIDFVNSNKNKAAIYLTLIIENNPKAGDFTIRYGQNPESGKFARILEQKLPESFNSINLTKTMEEIDYSKSTDSKDFLIASTQVYQKEIPVVMLVINNANSIIPQTGNANPKFPEQISNAIISSFSEYFGNFGQIPKKDIYQFCVESGQKIYAYDAVKGKAESRNVQYKFAIKISS